MDEDLEKAPEEIEEDEFWFQAAIAGWQVSEEKERS